MRTKAIWWPVMACWRCYTAFSFAIRIWIHISGVSASAEWILPGLLHRPRLYIMIISTILVVIVTRCYWTSTRFINIIIWAVCAAQLSLLNNNEILKYTSISRVTWSYSPDDWGGTTPIIFSGNSKGTREWTLWQTEWDNYSLWYLCYENSETIFLVSRELFNTLHFNAVTRVLHATT